MTISKPDKGKNMTTRAQILKELLAAESKTTEKDLFANTTWVNNTAYTAKFRIMEQVTKNSKRGDTGCGILRNIVLKPGDKITIQSIHDSAIRTVNKDSGLVVGGLCPWLEIDGEEEKPELHDCLNFQAVMEEEKVAKLAAKLAKDKAREEAIKMLAQEQVKEESEPKTRGRKASVV